ncbi:hypothetical protein ACS0TY_006993 [Phlomoides rotata]
MYSLRPGERLHTFLFGTSHYKLHTLKKESLHNTKRLQYPHFQLHKSQQYTTPPLFLI